MINQAVTATETLSGNWPLVTAILALAGTIGGAAIAIGRFMGKTDEKAENNRKDIDSLWGDQRTQDERTLGHISQLAQLGEQVRANGLSMNGLREDLKEVRLDVKKLLRQNGMRGSQ